YADGAEDGSVALAGWVDNSEYKFVVLSASGALGFATSTYGASAPFAEGAGVAWVEMQRRFFNGSYDHAFAPEIMPDNPIVFAREPDGDVIVGGKFDDVDAMAYTGLFRLQADDPPAPRLANIST